MPGRPIVERGPLRGLFCVPVAPAALPASCRSRLPGMDSTPGPISSRSGLRGAPRFPGRCGATSWDSAMPISSSAGLWILLLRCPASRALRRPAAGDGKRFAVGSSVTASSVVRRRLSLVAHAGGFLEVEIGGGGAHAGFEVGDHRLEIMADGGGLLELAFGSRAGADQHVVALVDAVRECRRCPCGCSPA